MSVKPCLAARRVQNCLTSATLKTAKQEPQPALSDPRKPLLAARQQSEEAPYAPQTVDEQYATPEHRGLPRVQ